MDGKGYEFGPATGGGIAVAGLPAGSALPAVLAPGSYRLSVVDRSPLFLNLFYLALGVIIMGVGFLKANISSIVGQLYPQGDPRRDPGFTLYYYGVEPGRLLGRNPLRSSGRDDRLVGRVWFGRGGYGRRMDRLHAWTLLAGRQRRASGP